MSELGFVGLKDFGIICFTSRRDDRSVETRSPSPFFAFRRNATTRDNEVAFLRNAGWFFVVLSTERSSLRDEKRKNWQVYFLAKAFR